MVNDVQVGDGGRPDQVARTMAQAALQSVARAMHTAQLALDATRRMGNKGGSWCQLHSALEAMRDQLMDAYKAVPEALRADILRAPGTIGGDELLDLLATLVRARDERAKDNNATR